MGYQDKIRLIEREGWPPFIDTESCTNLNALEWADFIKDRLHGRESPSIPACRDELSHEIFESLAKDFKELEKPICEGIRNCLDRAYDSLAQKRRDWRRESIEELLSLIFNIGYGYGTDEEKNPCEHPFYNDFEKIKRFLEVTPPKPSRRSLDLYARTLSTLCDLRAPLTYEFWVEQLEISPLYADICFDAMMSRSVDNALRMLHQINWEKRTNRPRMESLLEIFFEDHKKNEETMKKILAECKRLPRLGRKVALRAYEFAKEYF